MSLLDTILGGLGYTKKNIAAIEKAAPMMVEKGEKESLAQNPLAVTFASLLGDPGMKRPSKISMQTLRKMSRTNWVDRTCITTLRDEITALPWNIEPIDPKKSYNEKLQAYFTKILMKPNANNENWRTFIDKVVEDILVVDAGVVEKVRDDDGFIKELFYVDGATIRPRFDEHGIVGNPAYEQYVAETGPGATINSNKVVAEWPNEDLIYMQWNPQGAMDVFPYGLSPVEAGLAVATAFLYAEAFNLGFFRNNAIPPVIFNLGKDTSNTEVEKFRSFLAAEMSGEGGWHSPMVGAFGEGFGVEQVAKNPTDMAWSQYVEWQMRWKVALYRMSPQDIGFTLDQYKTEGLVQQQISKNKAVNSLKGVVQQYINTEILGDDCWEDGSQNLQFNWIDTEAIDPKVQAEVDQIYVNAGIKKRNEIRVDQGLDPVPGGDDAIVTAGSALIPITQAGMQAPASSGNSNDQTSNNSPFHGIDDKLKDMKKSDVKKKSVHLLGNIVGFSKGWITVDGKHILIGEGAEGKISTGVAVHGGATVSIGGREPTSGYAVSPYKGSETKISVEEFNKDAEKHVDQFVQKNYDLLSKSDHYIGAWVDNGQVYLDVSVVKNEASDAVDIAEGADQLAIYNIGEGVSIESKDYGNYKKTNKENILESEKDVGASNIGKDKGNDSSFNKKEGLLRVEKLVNLLEKAFVQKDWVTIDGRHIPIGENELSSANKKAVDDVMNGDKDDVEIKQGTARAEIQLEQLKDGTDTMNLLEIENKTKGNGDGSKMLDSLTTYSRETDTPISLRANIDNNMPNGGGLNQQQLVEWYESRGFVSANDRSDFADDKDFMIYDPPAKKSLQKGWVTIEGRHIYIGEDGEKHIGKDAVDTAKQEAKSGVASAHTPADIKAQPTQENVKSYVLSKYKYEDSSNSKFTQELLDHAKATGDPKEIEAAQKMYDEGKAEFEAKAVDSWNDTASQGLLTSYGEGQTLALSTANSFSDGILNEQNSYGMIMEGKADWIGKNINDVPEAQVIIQGQYGKIGSFMEAGNFAQAKSSEDQDLLSKATYSYKAPLGNDPSIVENMSQAYLNNGHVDVSDLKTNGEYEKAVENIAGYKDMISQTSDDELKGMYQENIDQLQSELPMKMMSDIKDAQLSSDIYSQEAVNQFATNIKLTQDTLSKENPSGTMTLYRGVQGDYATAIKSGVKSDGSVDIVVHPATSWTSNPSVAQTFAGKSGVVIQQDVPVSDILLSHETTPYIRTSDFVFSGTEESEYIVGNADGTMTITKDNIK